MKRFFILVLLLTVSAAWSAPVWNFDNLSHFAEVGATDSTSRLSMLPWKEGGPEKLACTMTAGDRPGAIQILYKWDAARHQPLPQAPFQLQLVLRHTVPSPIFRLPIRICDLQGEVFQFLPARQFEGKAGELTLVYEIREDSFQTSWGNHVNRKLDYPCYFAGIAIDRDAKAAREVVIFNELSVRNPGAPSILSRLPMLVFDPDANRISAAFADGEGRAELSGDGLRITGDASAVTISPENWREVVLPAPEAIRVVLKSDGGDGRITICRRDGTEVSAAWSGAGEKQLEIPFPKVKNPEGIFQNFRISFSGKRSFGLTITGMELVTRRTPAGSLECDVETGNPLRVLKTGEEKKLDLVFRNPSEASLSWRVKVEFRDFYGTGFDLDEPLSLAPGEKKILPVGRQLTSRGIWNLRFLVTGADGGTNEICRSFAYMADRAAGNMESRRDGFLFGICDHPLSFSRRDYRQMLNALTLAGAELFRTDVYWDSLQPEPGVWNFAKLDPIVDDLRARNIELNLIIHPVPRWAAPPERRDKGYWVWSRSRPMPGLYENACFEMAKRYRNKVRDWEIWNEVDLISKDTIDAADYLEVLKEGFRGIRRGDSDARIMTCGFAGGSNPAAQKGLQETVLKDGRGFYDIHAFHQHGGFAEFASVIDNRLLPMRKRLGVTAPWFANESALTSVGGTERVQAIALFKRILFAWSRGSVSYIWYNLINSGFDPFNGEHNYGLFTYDFHPKAAFSAYAELSRLYSGLKFDRQLDTRPGQYLFQFSGKNRIVLGGWNEAANVPTVPLLFKTDATKALAVDLMGNRTPVPIWNNRALFAVGALPGSLLLEGASYAEESGALLSVEMPGALVPGGKYTLYVSIENPFDAKVKQELDFHCPPGIRMDHPKHMQMLEPERAVKVPFEIEVSGQFSTAAEIKLDYRIQELTGTLYVPLYPATTIPPGKMETRPADLKISGAEHVYNLYQADPRNEQRNWKGPEDLSAQIWLANENNEFRIRAEVTDDKHVQPYTGHAVYQGDGVQAAFQLPDQTGLWEIGFSRLDDGSPQVFVWVTPSGFEAEKAAAAIQLTTDRVENKTIYEARIPFGAIGLTPAMSKQGFRANFIVNENDGKGRDGWIFLAPGMGIDKNPDRFPFFVFPETAR